MSRFTIAPLLREPLDRSGAQASFPTTKLKVTLVFSNVAGSRHCLGPFCLCPVAVGVAPGLLGLEWWPLQQGSPPARGCRQPLLDGPAGAALVGFGPFPDQQPL